MSRSSGGHTGVLPVCKPPGMTSHDVVATVRRSTGERHTGHGGTLDPAAAGVLLVLLGRTAARLAEYVQELPKVYLAEVRFGRTTDSQDFTGTTLDECPSGAAERLVRSQVEAVLPRFQGQLLQLPPMVSAVRVGGERLYRLAREGRTIERRPRPVVVHALDLIDFSPTGPECPLPVARLRVMCSKGTYVRTLAADIGQALGLGAHLGFLVRESVGSFRLADTFTLEEVAAAAASGGLADLVRTPAKALSHFPSIAPGSEELRRLRHGAMLALGHQDGPREDILPEGSLVRVLGPFGGLEAVAVVADGRLRPVKVFVGDGGHGTEV